MSIVKLLERKEVIQFFGLAAILAPFVDNYISAFVLPRGAPSWNFQVFINMISSRTLTEQLMFVSSIFIGSLMLQGLPSYWKLALFLLGCHILHQFIGFFQQRDLNSISVLFFVVNISIFLFVADQLAWKRKRAIAISTENHPTPKIEFQPEPPAPTPAPVQPRILARSPAPVKPRVQIPLRAPIQTQVQTQKKVDIYFEGFGNWAQLMDVSKDGIQVRCVTPPPAGIESRQIEISLSSGLSIRIRLSKRIGADLHFCYEELTSSETEKLNQWLLKQAS